ncbi:family 16 glycosylhydrolase [Arenibacter nanhaiticus]|nr:family 16 glycosylhydrolase [Arenibacter nanhaiticus]
MKHIIYSSIFLLLSLGCYSCQEEDISVGEIIAPSNILITASIVGTDADNPYGDGSGTVHFSAEADNALSYQFVYNDEVVASPSGAKTYNFSNTGLHTYTVTVVAIGTGGLSSSASVEVEVLALYEPPADLVTMLTANSSREWRIKAEAAGHFGLGPVGGSIIAEWFSAPAFDKAATGMYDDRFIFNTDGTFTHKTQGTIFGKAAIIDVDLGPTTEDTPNDCCQEYENYPLEEYSTTWSLSAPGGVETLSLSGIGFTGFYIGGSHQYEIFRRSANEMVLRTTDWNNEFDWWFVLTTEEEAADNEVDVKYTNLIWSDEFDANGAPNPAKWTYDEGVGNNGWGNGESQFYTRRPDNVVVEDGSLKITAKAESYEGNEYTSARIKTQGLFGFTYGRVDVRAKLPEGGGTWPAIWMLGANFDTVGWPATGEIDIMEHVGNNPNVVQAAIHTPSSSGATVNVGSITLSDVAAEFHVYSVNWSEDEISFLVDDELYYTYKPGTKDANTWPFNADQFIILNVAMGGNLGGTIDAAFSESIMEIDYVRVYQ